MKGKSITFRPKKELRERLDLLAKSTERPISYFIEKAIEAHLPALEEKHVAELEQHMFAKKTPARYPKHRDERMEERPSNSPSTKSGTAEDVLGVVEKHHPSKRSPRK